MGVIYLLVYVIGGFMATSGFSSLLDSAYDGSPYKDGLQTLAKAAGIIALAAVLHVLAVRRHREAKPVEDTPAERTAAETPGAKGFPALYYLGAAGLWAAPNIAGWIQFELFRDSIVMIGIPTLVGGYALTFMASLQLMSTWRMPWVGIMVALSFIGTPLAWLGNSPFIKHFNHHLVTVVEPMSRTKQGHEREPIIRRGYGPDGPMRRTDVTEGLSAELSEARSLDIEKELASGRVRRTSDGGYAKQRANGTERRLRSEAELVKALDDAYKAEDLRMAEAEAAYARELRQLKLGGRLFTRVPAD